MATASKPDFLTTSILSSTAVDKNKAMSASGNYESDENENNRKKSRIGSDDRELECNIWSKISIDIIKHIGCKLSFCITCAKVTNELFQIIMSGELEDFIWSCRN